MIIQYDNAPNVPVDKKIQSLKESIQLALNNIDAGALSGTVNNTVKIDGGSLQGIIDGDYLFIKNLDAESITAVQGWIDKLLVQTHLLANEGEVFQLDAIEVNASKIKTGTLDVERLIYTNQQTGEKYLVHFNPDGSTAYEKLDGNVIEDLTITADKIVSESILARHITTQNIEGTGGWINLRNGTFYYGNGATFAAANNALEWNGSKLKIKADEFLLSSGKSIFDEIEAIETWFYAVPPTTSNPPANSWTTENLKEMHLRDIYFDTTTGKSYRWAKEDNAYKWVLIEDVELAAVTRRLSSAETSVRQTKTSIESLASANETYVKPDGTEVTNPISSSIKQQADRIGMVVKNADASSSLELTPTAMTYIGGHVEIKDSAGTSTVISGGKIKAHGITANEITANDIVGTNGRINLAQGKFRYTNGDKPFDNSTNGIEWDGTSLKIKGKVEISSSDTIPTKQELTTAVNKIEGLTVSMAVSGGNLVFAVTLIQGGEDITSTIPDGDFEWFYRTPEGDVPMNRNGKSITIAKATQEYGRTVVCVWTRNQYAYLLNNSGNNLVTNTGNKLVGRSEY